MLLWELLKRLVKPDINKGGFLMEKIIDLNEFACGAMSEQMNIELAKVLKNIADPNTDHKTKRKLVLTLTFKTDESRDMTVVDVKTQSKLAPPKALNTKILIGQDFETGQIIGKEYKKQVPGQIFVGVNTETGEIHEGHISTSGLQVLK